MFVATLRLSIFIVLRWGHPGAYGPSGHEPFSIEEYRRKGWTNLLLVTDERRGVLVGATGLSLDGWGRRARFSSHGERPRCLRVDAPALGEREPRR